MTPSKRTPRYVQVSNYVRILIEQNNLKKGDPLPTEADLCKKFQCSRGTVRQAMELLVHAGKIRRLRGAGTFVSEPWPSGKRNLLAVIVPNVVNSELARFVQMLGVAAIRKGYTLLPGVTNDIPEIEDHFITEVIDLHVAGILKFPTNIEREEEIRERLRKSGIPYAVINDFWTDVRKDCHIAYDECEAVDMAVEHLAGMGHHRIALLESIGWPRLQALDAFLKSLKRRGLPSDKERHLLLYDISRRAPLERLFGEGNLNPTGLVTVYDTIATSTMRQLSMLEMRVPRDVSVVNVNGHPLGPGGEPDLTAVVPPNDKIIERSIRLLERGYDRGQVRHYFYTPELHVGTTSGPCREVATTGKRQNAGTDLRERRAGQPAMT